MAESEKKIKIPSIKLWWPKRGQSVKPQISMTRVTVSGILFTCILLSLCSGFIDLVYFSGLSKSKFTIFGNVPVAAGILYTLISIGLISAKFWCATWLGAIKELQNRFKQAGFNWYRNLDKLKFKWSFAHKFLIVISIITSISLSVVSVGDAIRRNQNVIKEVNTAKEKIEKYANTTDASDEMQFSALLSGTAQSSTAGQRAAALAAKCWPIIEEYRVERAAFEEQFGPNNFSSTDEVEWKGKKIIPNDYWIAQNSLVANKVKAQGYTLSVNQIRNITSEAILATRIKNEIEKSVANNSLDNLTELAGKTREKAQQEIRNLEGKFYMPGSKKPVVFDENNISGALSKLSDIKAAYENDNGDVGDSAKMFMLIGPTIDKSLSKKVTDIEEAYNQKVSVSSFGSTEIMIMIFIMIIGFAQELLIALFTPKATIDRVMLSKFDNYFEKFDVNRFLIGIYMDYLEKGVISQTDFEAKVKKCVAIMEKNSSVDAVIERYSSSKKTKVRKTTSTKVALDDNSEKIVTRSIPEGAQKYSHKVDELIEEIEKEINNNDRNRGFGEIGDIQESASSEE